MGRIGSTEMYLIWKRFGPTVISAGLIIITGSRFRQFVNTASDPLEKQGFTVFVKNFTYLPKLKVQD